MQLSSKSHHACLAVLDLCLHHHQSQPVSLRSIADEHGISSQFLVQVLLQLKRAGIVVSVRGATGGYRLARRPEEISLLDVVEAVEGPLVSGCGQLVTTGTERSAGARALHSVWQEHFDTYRQQLSEVTFQDLVQRCHPQRADMYYI